MSSLSMDSAAPEQPASPDLWQAVRRGLDVRPVLTVNAVDVGAAVANRLDVTRLRPRLADGVEVVHFTTRWGSGYTMLKTPRGPAYYRFAPEEGVLLDLFDGGRTVAELIVDRLRDSEGFDPGLVTDLVQLLDEANCLTRPWVDTYDLVEQRVASTGERLSRRLRAVFRSQTVHLRHADAWTDRLYRMGGRHLFTRPAHVVFLVMMFGGGALFYADVTQRHFQISSKALATSFGLLFLFDILASVIHEVGHALATRHAGRKVLSAGFQLYLGHPAFFVDSADIMLAPPRARIRQAWYGPYSGFAIAGLCGALVWWLPGGGFSHVLFNLAVLTYITGLMNLIPFLELDGYWMLMDALHTTDLRPRSLAFLRRGLVGRLRARQRLSRFEAVLTGFGVLGAVFTVLALLTSYLFWRPVFSAFVASMWGAGTWARGLLLVIAVFVLGPLVHAALEFLGSVLGRARAVGRRLRFRAELGWRREAGQLLSELPVTDELPMDALNELAGRVRLVRVSAGHAVIRQGEQADAFFVVRRGSVRVVAELPDGAEEELRTLGRGESFGELALLQSQPRSATVRAREDTELFAVDKGSFERLLAASVQGPEARESVRLLTEVWGLAPFRHLGADAARQTAGAGHWVACAADVDVVRQGEPGDRFYVVAAGQATVLRDGARVADLGPGDFFGETALLLDVPRTATVRTLTPARLFALDREAFDGIIAAGFRHGTLRQSAVHRALPERT